MKMNKLSALIIASLASISSFADWEVNMPRGVSPTANAAYDLHMLIFYITVVIGVIVFGVMFYSIFITENQKELNQLRFMRALRSKLYGQ